MDERPNPPIWLMVLPLLGLVGLVAYQYLVPREAPVDVPDPAAAALQATEAPEAQAPNQDPNQAPNQVEARPAPDPQARASVEQRYQLETDRFVASFTNLNTALVSLEVKGRPLPR